MKIKIKKEDVYLIIAIIIALGTIFLTYLGGKSTGFGILEDYNTEEECVISGYSWINETNTTCTNITTCINETIEQWECLEYEIIIINETTNETGDCINWSSFVNETCSEQENCVEAVIGGYCTGDCSPSHLELCNETNCEDIGGGYWYDETCNVEEESSCSNNLELCNETNCEDIGGGYWYDETCNVEEESSCSNNLELCNETNCEDIGGGYWYDETCNEDECDSDKQCESGYECDDGKCVVILENETETTESASESSEISESITQITPNSEEVISTTELTIYDISKIELKSLQSQENVLIAKNTGTEPLSSCILKATGDLSDWISISGESKNIGSGEEKSFNFVLNIPEGTNPGSYNMGLSIECSELSKGKEFSVSVIKETFEFDLLKVKKIRDERVKAEYTLSDLSGLDQSIKLDFKLIDNQSKKVSETTEFKNLSANLSNKFYTLLEINESVEGNLTLMVDLNSETYSSSVQEPIVLTSPPILGFAVFDNIGDLGNIILLVSSLLVLFLLIFLIRRIRKRSKKKNS
jgi:hypothetical protein